MSGRYFHSAVQCMLALRRLSWTHRVMHTPHSVLAALTTHCTWTDDRDGRVDCMDGRTGRRPDGHPVLWCMRTSVHVLHVSIDAYLTCSKETFLAYFAKKNNGPLSFPRAVQSRVATIPVSHGQRSECSWRSRNSWCSDRADGMAPERGNGNGCGRCTPPSRTNGQQPRT